MMGAAATSARGSLLESIMKRPPVLKAYSSAESTFAPVPDDQPWLMESLKVKRFSRKAVVSQRRSLGRERARGLAGKEMPFVSLAKIFELQTKVSSICITFYL